MFDEVEISCAEYGLDCIRCRIFQWSRSNVLFWFPAQQEIEGTLFQSRMGQFNRTIGLSVMYGVKSKLALWNMELDCIKRGIRLPAPNMCIKGLHAYFINFGFQCNKNLPFTSSPIRSPPPQFFVFYLLLNLLFLAFTGSVSDVQVWLGNQCNAVELKDWQNMELGKLSTFCGWLADLLICCLATNWACVLPGNSRKHGNGDVCVLRQWRRSSAGIFFFFKFLFYFLLHSKTVLQAISTQNIRITQWH